MQRTRKVALVPAVALEISDTLPARQVQQRRVIAEMKMTPSIALAVSNPPTAPSHVI